MPWVKRKRRRKWYRNTDPKAYLLIIISCLVVAVILSFLMDQTSVSINGPEKGSIEKMARQSGTAGTPGPARRIEKPPLDGIGPAECKRIEELKRAYPGTGKPDALGPKGIEELKRKYSSEMDSEDLERLIKKYAQPERMNPDR